MTDNEMTISEYDVKVFEHKKQLDKNKHERSMQRIAATGWVFGVAVFLAGAFAIIMLIWNIADGPGADEQLMHEQKMACIENEGSFVVTERSDNGTEKQGTCIFGEAR